MKNGKKVKFTDTMFNRQGRDKNTVATQYIVNQYLLRPPNM